MRQKLAFASGVLEGITLEKFDLVFTNAVALRNMSTTNAFVRLQNPDYRQLTTNFQATADALISAAKAKNLSGVTAGYQKLVVSNVTKASGANSLFGRRRQALVSSNVFSGCKDRTGLRTCKPC